jgi:hypothetical protein
MNQEARKTGKNLEMNAAQLLKALPAFLFS